MERIGSNATHTKETFLYSGSKALERASYYGLRALIVIFMIEGGFDIPNDRALNIYGWFTTGMIVSNVFGAMIGDFFSGNKAAIILGGFLQALGCFVLCAHSLQSLYIGLGLIIAGGGFYSPNLTAQFGKLYLMKTKLLDGAFTTYYTFINIGAFFGILIVSYIGESSFKNGFALAGILMVFATIITFFVHNDQQTKKIKINILPLNAVFLIVVVLLVTALFWGVYNISGSGIYLIESQIAENATIGIPRSIWSGVNSVFSILIGFIAAILWTLYYTSQIRKAFIGFVLGCLSLAILLYLPENPGNSSIPLWSISVILLAAAEIHLSPIVHSILTKFVNPKFLATAIALSYIPTRSLMALSGLEIFDFYSNPGSSISFGTIVYGIIAIVMGIIMIIVKHAGKQLNQENNIHN
jgi:POT family proton-dependent oligopeptide transporter